MRRVIFWCALNIPSAPGVSQTLCDTTLVLPSASHCCTAALYCLDHENDAREDPPCHIYVWSEARPFHPGRIIGAGGKPSTWLPPGKLADMLNNYTIHVLYPHTHVMFWCVPQIPHTRGDIRTPWNLLSRSEVFPIAALLILLAILSYF